MGDRVTDSVPRTSAPLAASERVRVCRVLEHDLELAEAVPPAERAAATARCIAPTAVLPTGAWRNVRADFAGGGIGLLVLSGLLIRRVGVDGRFGAELLGPGDLLRPWQWEDDLPVLPLTTGWRVLETARLAVLDKRFVAHIAHHPDLAGALVGRALDRSRNLSVNMAIVHQPRVDVRLRTLFWHLANRWGVVGRDGVVLRLRLTHSVLADLVAARRPTVTTAIADLTRAGVIRPIDDGLLLCGQPPGELLELTPPEPGVQKLSATA